MAPAWLTNVGVMESEPTHEDMGQYMHRRFPQWYGADGSRTPEGEARSKQLKADVLELLGGPAAKHNVA